MTAVSRRPYVIATVVAGMGLFALTLRTVDVRAVLVGMQRLGTGFSLIFVFGGLRLAARAAGWTACAGGRSRLPLRAAFGGCIAGEAAGNLTPLGLAGSEPAKVLWVREHLGTVESGAALAVETLLYSLVVVAMLLAGGVVAAVAFAPSAVSRAVLLGLSAAAFALILWAAARRHSSPPERSFRLAGWLERKGHGRPRVAALAHGVRRSGEILRSLASRRPGTLVWVCLLELAFHASSVVEVWLTLVWLGIPGATLFQAFLLDTVNRAVSVAFRFVPLRFGVDELASGGMASLLGSGSAVGVTLAVVRKARMLAWSAVGLGVAGVRAIARRFRTAKAVAIGQPLDSVAS
jgi:hypothetical protein